MKTIVTHLNPDLDAMSSVWLLKRFLPGWEEAEVRFVPAGIYKQAVSSKKKVLSNDDEETLVVDTGFGELDHHQTDEKTCAAMLVREYIKNKLEYSSTRQLAGRSSRPAKRDSNNKINEEAIERLVNVVLRIDYGAEDITIKNAEDDFFAFLFNERQIIRGLRTLYRGQSDKQLNIGMTILDAIYEVLKAKIEAEEIISVGLKFKTIWGEAVAAETNNEIYMHLAQQKGYKVVVSKDPKKGHIRIHALPKRGIDFTNIYEVLKKKDPEATWYLHSSKALLLNGSSANPDMRPTRLNLEEVIEVLKSKT
ncbi:hypothetical protein HY030_02545 [Candidatus Gottesmanbacteria bacterium]|nr:hypothetical protein [Candidatus Gottesmanbacteria bacterium]